MTGGGTVDAPIGRHPTQRTRMAVVGNGKPAISHYRVTRRYRAHTHIKVNLETGRTHQIRLHMAHIRYPLIGDPLYGGRLRLPRHCTTAFADTLRGFRRQALHAWRLALRHPRTDQAMAWESPLPGDFSALLAALERDRLEHGDDT